MSRFNRRGAGLALNLCQQCTGTYTHTHTTTTTTTTSTDRRWWVAGLHRGRRCADSEPQPPPINQRVGWWLWCIAHLPIPSLIRRHRYVAHVSMINEVARVLPTREREREREREGERTRERESESRHWWVAPFAVSSRVETKYRWVVVVGFITRAVLPCTREARSSAAPPSTSRYRGTPCR